MGQRLELQTALESLLESGNVYFQPPPSKDMTYPCVIYKLDDADVKFAGNQPYSHVWRYQLTVIDPNPDTLIRSKVLAMPLVRFDRHFAVGNLNHYVFELYY